MPASWLTNLLAGLKQHHYLITWVLTVISWSAANFFSKQRESKAFQRERATYQLRHILDDLDKIRDLSITYHTSSEYDSNTEWRIKESLERLKRDIDDSVFVQDGGLQDLYMMFRKSITLRNFETKKHEALLYETDFIRNIIEKSDQLKSSLEHYFNSYSK